MILWERALASKEGAKTSLGARARGVQMRMSPDRAASSRVPARAVLGGAFWAARVGGVGGGATAEEDGVACVGEAEAHCAAHVAGADDGYFVGGHDGSGVGGHQVVISKDA
jgi:hypothetical protein